MSEDQVLEEHRRTLCMFLERQVRLIDFCIAELVEAKSISSSLVSADIDVVDTVLMMVQGMGVSSHSVLKLSEKLGMSLRDCLGICRSIVETGINIAYIVAGGSDLAERARRHARQKAFRDLGRQGKIGPWSFSLEPASKPDISAIPELQLALDEFSDSKGRETRDWTKDNLDSRLHLIEKAFPRASLYFATAVMQIYRHSSEILHGTYFGTVYFWRGIQKDGKPEKDELLRYFLSNHLVMIVSSAFFAQGGVIDVVARRYEFTQLRKESEELFRIFGLYVENDLANFG